MVEIAEIVDQESFGVWMREAKLARQAKLLLAYRSAMRALPVWWSIYLEKPDLFRQEASVLSIIRCYILTYDAAQVGLPPKKRCAAWGNCALAAPNANVFTYVTDPKARDLNPAAALAATAASASATNAVSAAAMTDASGSGAAALSSAIAINAVRFPNATDPNGPGSVVAEAYSGADMAPWAALREDCLAVFALHDLACPLWPGGKNPIQARWDTVVSNLPKQASPYRFWMEWYTRALEGQSENADLLRAIALIDKAEDGSDVWKDADLLAARVAELEVQYG